MTRKGLTSLKDDGRGRVRSARFYGLDYLEVKDQQTTLEVCFLGRAPANLSKDNISIIGGKRIRNLQVIGIKLIAAEDPTLDDYMEVRVNKPGDFSIYTLKVVGLDERGQPTDQPLDGFDHRYSSVDFSFKASCPSGLDCKPKIITPSPHWHQPEINYLAKDYASFRQLILDRLALITPNWQERHVPDIGITLVELLAYVGDYLSYYQDAVATEAYLGTARQRISVRRHARLVDYFMHEGCNARVWISLWTNKDYTFQDDRQIFFVTGFPAGPTPGILQEQALVNVPDSSYEVFEPLPQNPDHSISVYKAHSEIHFYTWGSSQYGLAQGATSATLVDWDWWAEQPSGSRQLNLREGDVLIFEEVIGPKTAAPADSNPKHRQAVRLIRVTQLIDELYPIEGSETGSPLVDVEWAQEDALAFPLCITATGPAPGCALLENISVARGNVILADNGSRVEESLGVVPTQSSVQRCPTACDPGETLTEAGPFTPRLKEQPLSFSQPLRAFASINELISQEPRHSLPSITLLAIPPADPSWTSIAPLSLFWLRDHLGSPQILATRLRLPIDEEDKFLVSQLRAGTKAALNTWDGSGPFPESVGDALVNDLHDLLETWIWRPRLDLLESGPDDQAFVVEIDNDGDAHLRFGDGRLGKQPEAGAAFLARYRLGNGSPGNVGAETISYLVLREVLPDTPTIKPRNLLAAQGGKDPEPLADVKRYAPNAFRQILERAVTAGDYATLAADNARRRRERTAIATSSRHFEPGPFQALQAAKASLRWNGSWYGAVVAVDPIGTERAEPELLQGITTYLEPYRRIAHDLDVKPATYVPLDLALAVCVLPDYLQAHVEEALRNAFSNRVLADGNLGFFHPDNLSFGNGIYFSRIVASAQAIAGVQHVEIIRLDRYQVGGQLPGVQTRGQRLAEQGFLPLGPFEIAQLDNDPNFPENGRLSLELRGGR